MISIIVIDQGKGVLGRRKALDDLKTIVPTDTTMEGLDDSNTERLYSLISDMQDEDCVLFVNSNSTSDIEAISVAVNSFFNELHNEIAYAPCRLNEEKIDLFSTQLKDLVRVASDTDVWPMGCVSMRVDLLREHIREELSISKSLIYAICDGIMQQKDIKKFGCTIPIDTDFGDETCMMYTDLRAKLLNYVVNSCNIEDLFPQHEWDKYGEESAAASYHTLAALFYKLKDIEDAKECLSFSEKLEDSPRSLALRALIAMQDGESLGAVANLISSLQCYEARKKSKETDIHYLSFEPKDLEAINSYLHRGLEALNKRKNDEAVHNFAAAVFDFDDFYKEVGVDSIPN